MELPTKISDLVKIQKNSEPIIAKSNIARIAD
jgi:hypothetical protein